MKRALSASAAILLPASAARSADCMVTVTNDLDGELLAPILITSAGNDPDILDGGHVIPEAEARILAGDPAMLAGRIGSDAMVGHGTDGPPGVLPASGKSVTFGISADATAVRVPAMVAPTMVPDNHVSDVVDLHAGPAVTALPNRFDIGHDEGINASMRVGDGAATIEFTRKQASPGKRCIRIA